MSVCSHNAIFAISSGKPKRPTGCWASGSDPRAVLTGAIDTGDSASGSCRFTPRKKTERDCEKSHVGVFNAGVASTCRSLTR